MQPEQRRQGEDSGAGTASCPGKGALPTVATVQEVRDKAGAAGGPGLLGVHVSHHGSHDMTGGAPRPVQADAWL